jgi:hypothetical protein
VEHVGGDPAEPLSDEERAAIVAALDGLAAVLFVPDRDSLIDDDLRAAPGVDAIVTVGRPDVDGDHADIPMELWCGSLCGTWLTYRAVRVVDGWSIDGPIGPIAVA